MRNPSRSGVLVASGLLLVGVATAGVAWWYNLSHTQRALEHWGPGAVALIRDATQVTVFRVAPTADHSLANADSQALAHPDSRSNLAVLEKRDVSRAKGLLHLRHALLDDRSFAWREAPSGVEELAYALAFEEDDARLVIYLSADFMRMTSTGLDAARDDDAAEPTSVSTRPIAEGLQVYFADLLQ